MISKEESQMSRHVHRAIIVIGAAEPTEATLAEAEHYDEVLVIARVVPDANDRWVIDGDRTETAARDRLARVLARLRAHGVRAFGALGDENATAARADARALFPAKAILGE
jgi:hypothetical protein